MKSVIVITDDAAVTFAVMDPVRAEVLHRVGLGDLLVPATPAVHPTS
jgi:hypothetical protein